MTTAPAMPLQRTPALVSCSVVSRTAPLPLHLRLRPESGVLPRGWLVELRTRYEEGPEGFIAIDRDLPEDGGAPKVLGWGIDRRAARAAAARNTNRDPSTLLVHPCTARLRQAVVDSQGQDVRTDVFEDVAYAEQEAAPDTVVDTWLEEHGVYKAHGEACGDIANWDETLCLVTAMAYAYLNAHPAVAMTSDGRLGWTGKAKLRGSEASPTADRRSGYGTLRGEDDVVPLSVDIDEARAAVRENL